MNLKQPKEVTGIDKTVTLNLELNGAALAKLGIFGAVAIPSKRIAN